MEMGELKEEFIYFTSAAWEDFILSRETSQELFPVLSFF